MGTRRTAGLRRVKQNCFYKGKNAIQKIWASVCRPDDGVSPSWWTISGRGRPPTKYGNCKTNIQEPRRAGWRTGRPSAGHLPHGKLICGTMRVWSKVASLATSVFACSFVSARYNGAEGADSDPYEPVNRKPNLTATLAARPNREAWLLGRE